jgi:hypothetical protein
LFAGWGEHHGKQEPFQPGEDMCGRSRKVARFEIVCKMGFDLQQECVYEPTTTHIHKKKNVFLYYVNTFIYMKYEQCKMCIASEDSWLKKKKLVERSVFKCSSNVEFLMLMEEHVPISTSSSACSWRELKTLLRTISKRAFWVARYTCPLQRTNSGNSPSPSCKEKINLC